MLSNFSLIKGGLPILLVCVHSSQPSFLFNPYGDIFKAEMIFLDSLVPGVLVVERKEGIRKFPWCIRSCQPICLHHCPIGLPLVLCFLIPILAPVDKDLKFQHQTFSKIISSLVNSGISMTSEKIWLVGTYCSCSKDTICALGNVNEEFAASCSDLSFGFDSFLCASRWNIFKSKWVLVFQNFFFVSSKLSNLCIFLSIAFSNQAISSFFFHWMVRHQRQSSQWIHSTFCWRILLIVPLLGPLSSVPLLKISSNSGFFWHLFLSREGSGCSSSCSHRRASWTNSCAP